MTDTDKISLNLADDEALKEHFSRKEPGDVCRLEITATLDEEANDQATLSITKVKVLNYDDPEGDTDDEDTAEGPEDGTPDAEDEEEGDEPVMKMMKGKSKAKAGASSGY